MKRNLAVLVLASLPATALASSEEAWEDFREAVRTSCRALVDRRNADRVTIETSPFGSETYGAALVTVERDGGVERMICVYDKATKRAELAAPFQGAAQ